MTEGAAIAVSLGLAAGITGAVLGAEAWYQVRRRRSRTRSLHPEERAILRARAVLGTGS